MRRRCGFAVIEMLLVICVAALIINVYFMRKNGML